MNLSYKLTTRMLLVIFVFISWSTHTMDDEHLKNSDNRLRRSKQESRVAPSAPEFKLLQAISNAQSQRVEELIEAAPWPLDTEDNTALHLVQDDHIALLLLRALKDTQAINAQNKAGKTPLHMVKRIQIARILLGLYENAPNPRPNCHLGDKEGWIPLHLAVAGALPEKILKEGAHYDDIENGEIAKLLINHLQGNPQNFNKKTLQGKTPLHMVRNVEIARLLIDAKASPLAQDNNGQTPLHVAASEALVELLLNNGANASLRDFCERFPVHTLSDVGAMRALLDAGIEGIGVHTLDNLHNIPLHLAHNSEIAFLLLSRGASTCIMNSRNATPLINSHVSTILDLIERQESNQHQNFITARDRIGNTALHLATDPRIAQLFLQVGGSVDITNHGGLTPLACMCRLFEQFDGNNDQYFHMIVFLLDRQATIDNTDVIQTRVIERVRQRQLRGGSTPRIPKRSTPADGLHPKESASEESGTTESGNPQSGKTRGCCLIA